MINRPTVFKRWYNKLTSETTKKMDIIHMESPEKSKSDKKHYRALELPNGLRAILVSEAEVGEPKSSLSAESLASVEDHSGKISACAVVVNVGSFYAPKKFQGLAHFLEHMIFLGSKKYPEENAYQAFMAKTGGLANAHTENDMTIFHFEVNAQYLDKALDILMNLMKSPLMSIDSMTRERSAVQSEFDRAYSRDGMRFAQLVASMANEKYPHNTFGCGNLKSLAENVDDAELHKELHDFHRKHYGSNRMTVSVQSTLPLDTLQEILVRHCSDIPRSQEEAMDVSKLSYRNAFQERFFRDVLLVKPIAEMNTMCLIWILPSMHAHYIVKPCKFLSALLSYEGVGSLCAYLRRRLWASSVSASEETNFIFTKFQIRITMTKEGFDHLDEIIAVTFEWVRMICSPDTTVKPKFKEMQQIAETHFRFQKEPTAVSNVMNIANCLRIYPIKHVLTGKNLYYEYNEDIVKMVQQHLSEFRFQLSICSQVPYGHYQYDQQERWFGTQYTQITMPEVWKNMWTRPETNPELQFPASNPFIPTDFTIHWEQAGRPHIPRCPKALIQNELCELWFRQDDTFLLPEGSIALNLITPVMRQSVHEYLAGSLFTQLVDSELAEQVCPAVMTMLNYGLNVTDTGFELSFRGYSEKMPLLCEMVVNTIKTLKVDPSQMMSIREAEKQAIYNSLVDPSDLNDDLFISVTQQKGWTLLEKYEAIQMLTPQDIERLRETFHKKMYIQALIQGNFTEKQARQVTENVLNAFDSAKFEHYTHMHNRTLQLPHGEFFLRVKSFNVDDVNTALANYYQLGPSSVTMKVVLELLDLITWEPYFHQLRTKEEMCYALGIANRITNNIGGYILNIKTQETKFAADFVEKRVEKFHMSVLNIVRKLSQEEYEQFRQALINKKTETNLTLYDELSFNWTEIINREYFFDRSEIEVNTIAALERTDVLELMELFGNSMRKLSVQVIGSSHPRAPQSESHISTTTYTPLSEAHNKKTDEHTGEQTRGKLKLKFVGDPNNPSHIIHISEFKNNLYVYPPVFVNQKMKKQDA